MSGNNVEQERIIGFITNLKEMSQINFEAFYGGLIPRDILLSNVCKQIIADVDIASVNKIIDYNLRSGYVFTSNFPLSINKNIEILSLYPTQKRSKLMLAVVSNNYDAMEKILKEIPPPNEHEILDAIHACVMSKGKNSHYMNMLTELLWYSKENYNIAAAHNMNLIKNMDSPSLNERIKLSYNAYGYDEDRSDGNWHNAGIGVLAIGGGLAMLGGIFSAALAVAAATISMYVGVGILALGLVIMLTVHVIVPWYRKNEMLAKLDHTHDVDKYSDNTLVRTVMNCTKEQVKELLANTAPDPNSDEFKAAKDAIKYSLHQDIENVLQSYVEDYNSKSSPNVDTQELHEAVQQRKTVLQHSKPGGNNLPSTNQAENTIDIDPKKLDI